MRTPPTTVLLLLLLPLQGACDRWLADDSAGDTQPPEISEPEIGSVEATVHDVIGSIIVVSWEQLRDATVWVEYSYTDGEWHQSPATEAEAGQVEQLLLGVPFGATVSYRVVNDFGGGALADVDRSITAGALEEPVLPPVNVVAVDGAYDSTPYFMLTLAAGFYDPWWTFIMDRQGQVVWAWETDTLWASVQSHVSYDGTHIIIDYNSFWRQFDQGLDSRIYKFDIEGNIITTFDTPGLQHAYADMPDGSIVYGASSPVEKLVQVTPEGERSELWDCQTWLDSADASEDICHSNHLYWHEDTDTFLFSSYMNNTVVEIDRATGETLRWFGDVPGSWSFSPPDSQFFWQHGAHYLSDGTLLVSTKNAREGSETLVRQFALDEEQQTLEEVWSFGEGEGVYSPAGGGAHRFDNGNTLHHYGEIPLIREATPEGEVVWEVEWTEPDLQIGYVWPVDDLYALAP